MDTKRKKLIGYISLPIIIYLIGFSLICISENQKTPLVDLLIKTGILFLSICGVLIIVLGFCTFLIWCFK
jgi:hypothetical protein